MRFVWLAVAALISGCVGTAEQPAPTEQAETTYAAALVDPHAIQFEGIAEDGTTLRVHSATNISWQQVLYRLTSQHGKNCTMSLAWTGAELGSNEGPVDVASGDHPVKAGDAITVVGEDGTLCWLLLQEPEGLQHLTYCFEEGGWDECLRWRSDVEPPPPIKPGA